MPCDASRQLPHLTETDLRQIREAVRRWGKGPDIVSRYGDEMLGMHFDMWEAMVGDEWPADLYPEYHHDIGCRTWIQVAIEHATPRTRDRLADLVRPLDDVFKRRMWPWDGQSARSGAPLTEAAYFWDTHTILEGD
jgi:hypothetical protein